MLIHPADDDPSEFIAFRQEVAFPINGSPGARTTIEVLGLNREMLVDVRRDHLKRFKRLREAVLLLPPEDEVAQAIRADFGEALLPKAQYSSMMRAFVENPPDAPVHAP